MEGARTIGLDLIPVKPIHGKSNILEYIMNVNESKLEALTIGHSYGKGFFIVNFEGDFIYESKQFEDLKSLIDVKERFGLEKAREQWNKNT